MCIKNSHQISIVHEWPLAFQASIKHTPESVFLVRKRTCQQQRNWWVDDHPTFFRKLTTLKSRPCQHVGCWLHGTCLAPDHRQSLSLGSAVTNRIEHPVVEPKKYTSHRRPDHIELSTRRSSDVSNNCSDWPLVLVLLYLFNHVFSLRKCTGCATTIEARDKIHCCNSSGT